MPVPRSTRRVSLALLLVILALLGAGIVALFLVDEDDGDVAARGTTTSTAPSTTAATGGASQGPATAAPTAPSTSSVPETSAPSTTLAPATATSAPATGIAPTTTPTTTTGVATSTVPQPVIELGPSAPAPGPVTRSHPSTGGGPASWPAAAGLLIALAAVRARRQHWGG